MMNLNTPEPGTPEYEDLADRLVDAFIVTPEGRKKPLKFEANKKEQATFDAWSEEHMQKCGPSTATTHQRWAVTFVRHGIGDSTLVQCLICKEKKDITDTDSW